MEYLYEILHLVAWPILIFVSYKLSLLALKVFDKNLEKTK